MSSPTHGWRDEERRAPPLNKTIAHGTGDTNPGATINHTVAGYNTLALYCSDTGASVTLVWQQDDTGGVPQSTSVVAFTTGSFQTVANQGHRLISYAFSGSGIDWFIAEANLPLQRSSAAPPSGGGITDAFLVYNSADITIADGATTTLTFDTPGPVLGSPYTTPDDKEFDLELGFWQVGAQIRYQGSSPGSDGGWDIELWDFNLAGRFVLNTKHENTLALVTADVDTNGVVSLFDGIANQLQLACKVHNHLGYSIAIKHGITASYLWAVRLAVS